MNETVSSPQTRVLIADDEESQRLGLQSMIQSWGFAVETAADGQEALEKVSALPIQTIHDLGAFWFLEKPIQPAALKILLDRAAQQSRLTEETERLQRELQYKGVLVDMVGACPPMQQVFSLIRQVAPSRAAVFVTGESGTGKELVARAIHHLSPRRNGPFVAI